jgi:hypothetical protein
MRTITAFSLLIAAAGLSNAQSVNVDTAGNTWTYVLSNNSEPHEWKSLRSFTLPLVGPVSNIRFEGDDRGWQFETDNETYVRWYNPDGGPSVDDIDSGEFMVFLFESPFVDSRTVTTTVTTWDGWIGAEGQAFPTTVSPVPEPATLIALGVGALALFKRKRAMQPKTCP